MSTNVVVLSGRLGSDPNLKSLASGTSVCGFSLAVDKGFGDKRKTIWVTIETWSKLAEAVAKLTSKGKRVLVVGELDEEHWESNGEKKSRVKVIATKVDIIDYQEKDSKKEISDEDIPF